MIELAGLRLGKMLLGQAPDDDVPSTSHRTRDNDLVAYLNLTMWITSLVVHLDLSALACLLGL